jgi:hypothetical protein
LSEYLSLLEREQLALTSTYLGAFNRDKSNLLNGNYLIPPAGTSPGSGMAAAHAKLSPSFFKKQRKNNARSYNNISYDPKQLAYLIAQMSGKTGFGILRKLASYHLSFLVPKIRIFKVYTDMESGATEEVEITFPNFQEDVEFDTEKYDRYKMGNHIASSGLESFEATFQGVNEAEVENNIRCNLRMFFSDINQFAKTHEIQGESFLSNPLASIFGTKKERIKKIIINNLKATGTEVVVGNSFIMQSNDSKKQAEINAEVERIAERAAGKWRYVDLITPPLTHFKVDGTTDYYDDNYKVRVVFGWTVNEQMATMDARSENDKQQQREHKLTFDDIKELKNVLERVNYSIILNLTTHTFNLGQDGTLSVDAEYIGSVEQQLNSPENSIFARSSDGKAIIQRLRLLETKIASLESGADSFRRLDDEAQVKELNKQRDVLAREYDGLLSNFVVNAFWTFFYETVFTDPGSGGAIASAPTVVAQLSDSTDLDSLTIVTNRPGAGLSNVRDLGEIEIKSIYTDPDADTRNTVVAKLVKTLLFDNDLLLSEERIEREEFIKSMKGLAGTQRGFEKKKDVLQPSETLRGADDADLLESHKEQADMMKVAAVDAATLAASVKVPSSITSQVRGLNEREGQIEEDRRAQLASLQADLTKKTVDYFLSEEQNPVQTGEVQFGTDTTGGSDSLKVRPVSFLTIGDIITRALISTTKAFQQSTRVVLGTVMVTRRTELDSKPGSFGASQGNLQVWHLPIEDIPISYRMYYKWYMENIVAKERYDYSIGELLSTGIRQLISLSLSNLGDLDFGNLSSTSISRVSFSLPKKQFDKIFPPVARNANNYVPLERFNDVLQSSLSFDSANYTDQREILLITSKPPSSAIDILGDLSKDEENGIKHFFIGADSDILISAEFQKDNLPGFRESRIKEASETGVNSQLSLISEPYLLSLRLVGNSLFYPGMRIYFHPTIMGLEDEAGFVLPLEGYYLIYEVKDLVESGNFQTELKCRFEHMPDKRQKSSYVNHKQFNNEAFFV